MENAIQSRLSGQRRKGSFSAHCQEWKGCHNQQVLCSIPEDNTSGSPDNVKIQIANERTSRRKRLLEESLEEGQSLPGDFKRVRLMNLYCSTPYLAQKEAFASPDSACFSGSSSFDETCSGKLVPVISLSLPESSLAPSTLASEQEQSELDDSLLETSDSEADSPFHFTEEKIQELLADDWSATGVATESLHSDYQSPEESRELDCCNVELCTWDVVEESSLSPSSSSSVPSSLLTLSVTECVKSLSLEHDLLESNKISNMPFDCNIELLALSPIGSCSIDQETEYYVVDKAGVQESFSRGDSVLPKKQGLMPPPAALGDCPLNSHSFDLSVLPGSRQLSKSEDGTSSEEVSSEILPFRSVNMPAEERPASCPENPNLQKVAALEEAAHSPDKLKEVASSKNYREENLQEKPDKTSLSKTDERPVKIPPVELERKKQIYVQCVLKHLKSPQEPLQDAFQELLTLMDQVASVEYRHRDHSWQHPADLTMRNYPRFSQKLPNKWSLKQWVSRNGGYHRRFQNLADRFQRNS